MNILFSADWHIKLNAKNIPNEWAKNRYKELFKQLHDIETGVDLHVIGGDIFDKVPSLEEVELYYEYVAGCKCKTIIYPGNHEALKKNTTFLSYLKNVTKILNPLVEIIDDYLTIENIDFIPYNKLKEYQQEIIPFEGNILCTHVRGEIPPHVKPEVPLDIFSPWDVVLAGDLHSYENCQRNILYPGSPITTSFHRKPVETGVIVIDSETLQHQWVKLKLPQLIRKTIAVGEPMTPTDYDHTIYEIEGDLSELGNIEDNELLDKKVVKKDNDTALILNPEMSIEQEITEYMQFILQVPEDVIEKALGEYHNNIKTTQME